MWKFLLSFLLGKGKLLGTGFAAGALCVIFIGWLHWIRPADAEIARLQERLAVRTEESTLLKATVEAAEARAQADEQTFQERLRRQVAERSNLQQSLTRSEHAARAALHTAGELRVQLAEQLAAVVTQTPSALAEATEQHLVEAYPQFTGPTFRLELDRFVANEAAARGITSSLMESLQSRLILTAQQETIDNLTEVLVDREKIEETLNIDLTGALAQTLQWKNVAQDQKNLVLNLEGRLQIQDQIINRYRRKVLWGRVRTVLAAGAAGGLGYLIARK